MFSLSLTLCRIYLNILLFASPSRLFSTIVKAEPYHRILTQWSEKLFSNKGKISVLEIGCGPGNLACDLASQGHEVTGIDLSKSMIRTADLISTQRKLSVDFQQANAAATEFPDLSFDYVIGASIINVVSEPALIIKEAWRLLKPKGSIAFLFPTDRMTSKNIYRFAIENNYSAFPTAVLITWATKANKLQPQSVIDLLYNGGFSNHQHYSIMDGMVVSIIANKETAG